MRKYSLVIPTMWRADLIKNICEEYPKSDYIDEVIIIDNNKKDSYKLSPLKTTIIEEDQNIYVNPAWNKGVSLSKNDYVIISNDDVYIENIDDLFHKIDDLEYDIICIDVTKSNTSSEVCLKKLPEDARRLSGYGSFFIMKKEKYIYIPEDIKIWYGDDILFDLNKERYSFSVPKVTYYTSKTVNSERTFRKITSEDGRVYRKFISQRGK